MSVDRRVSDAVNEFQPVREVLATPAASCIIEPIFPSSIAEVAYFDLSPTRSNARCTSPRFNSSGWIAPIDSEPKSCVAKADCFSCG
ncbi:hypothetical protein D9M71_748400 [compost metagenome]